MALRVVPRNVLADVVCQHIEVQWFFQVLSGTHSKKFCFHVRGAECCHHDCWYVGKMSGQICQELKSVHFRHFQVCNNQVDFGGIQDFDSFLSIESYQYIEFIRI